MHRTASIFIIVLIGLISLVTFQNCAKQPSLQNTNLPSVSSGTAITGQNYEAPNVYAQSVISTSPPVANPSVATLSTAVNSDVPGLRALFYNGSYMTVVPGQSLFLKIAYPQSLNLNTTDLFWNNVENGVRLAKAAFTYPDKNSVQIDYYRDGKTSELFPTIYSFEIQGDSKTNGAIVARSNTVNVNLAPICNVTYSATRATSSDKFTISVNTMKTISGDVSTSQSISKFILIPNLPMGIFNQQILVPSVVNATAELSAQQLNLGDNLFRLLGLAQNGDVICGSNPQVLNVYSAPPAASPTPTPIQVASPTPDPLKKVTLVTEGYLCSDHQLRVRVRHNVNKLVSADIMGSDSGGTIGYNCGDFASPKQVLAKHPDGSTPNVTVGTEVIGSANVKLDRISALRIKVLSYQEVQRQYVYYRYSNYGGDLSNRKDVYNYNLLASTYCPINSIGGSVIFSDAFPGSGGQIAKVKLEIEIEGYNDGGTPSYPIGNALFPTCTYGYGGGGGGGGGGNVYDTYNPWYEGFDTNNYNNQENYPVLPSLKESH